MSILENNFNLIIENHIKKLSEIVEKHKKYDLQLTKIKSIKENNMKRLSEIKEDTRLLRESIIYYKKKNSNLEIQINRQNSETTPILEKLEKNIEELNNGIEKNKIKITELNNNLENNKLLIDNLNAQIVRKDSEIALLTSDISRLKGDIDGYLSNIEKLKSDNNNKANQINELNTKINELLASTDASSELKTELVAIRTQLTEKNTELKEREEIIEKMTTDTTKVQSIFDEYDKEFNTKYNELDDLIENNLKLFSDIYPLEDQNKELIIELIEILKFINENINKEIRVNIDTMEKITINQITKIKRIINKYLMINTENNNTISQTTRIFLEEINNIRDNDKKDVLKNKINNAFPKLKLNISEIEIEIEPNEKYKTNINKALNDICRALITYLK